MHKVFVYGALKKGERNHCLLGNSRFLGEFRTGPKYRLYSRAGMYPCMVENSNGQSIRGEVYEVDEETLEKLDCLEGVDFGLYKRINLEIENYNEHVHGYLYLRNTTGLIPLEDHWDAKEHGRA